MGGTQTCQTVTGGTRCQLSCSGAGLSTQATPIYYSCSMYGMWEGSDRLVEFIYPSCTGKIYVMFAYSKLIIVLLKYRCRHLKTCFVINYG